MKIPTYTGQVNPAGQPTPESNVRVPVEAFTAVGKGVEEVGKGLLALNEGIEKREAEESQLWALNRMSQLRADALEDFQVRVQGMTPGGSGFSKQVNDSYQEKVKEAVTGAPNEKSKTFLQARAYEYANVLFSHAVTEEARERSRYKVQSFKDATDKDAESLRLDPLLLNTLAKERLTAMESFEPRLKDESHTYVSHELMKSYLGTMSLQDPRGTIKEIDDGTMTKRFEQAGLKVDPDLMRQFRNHAEQRSNASDRLLASQIEDLARSDVTSLMNTGTPVRSALLTEETFRLAYGKENGQVKWGDYQQKRDTAKKVFRVLDESALKPLGEITSILKEIEPRPGALDYAEQNEIYRTVAQEIVRRQKVLHDDPFTAVNEVLSKAEVSAGFDTAGRLSKDPQVKRTDDYARMAMNYALQEVAGVPSERRKVMGNQQARDIVIELNTLAPDKAQERLNLLEEQYGPYYPTLYKQLQESKLNPGFMLVPWSQNTVSGNTMLEALRVSMDDAKGASGLSEPDVKKVNEAVKAATRDFVRTIAIGGISSARAQQIDTLQNTLTKAVLMKVGTMGRNIGDVSAAVQQVVDPMIKDRYDIFDTYYIPKKINERPGLVNSGLTVDTTTVRRRLENLKLENEVQKFRPKALGSRNFYITEGMMKESLVDVATNRGYWVTNETGDGIYLAIDAAGYRGLPIRNAKNERYEFKFEFMMDSANFAPSRTRSGKIKY